MNILLDDIIETRASMNKFHDKMVRKTEKDLKLRTRPFGRIEAKSVCNEIISGNDKHLYENTYNKNLDMHIVSYSSGKYIVYSVYDNIQDRYITRISYKTKKSALSFNRFLRNKQLQCALHMFGQTIKQ